MKIAYIGNVSLSLLEAAIKFDRELPAVRWGFSLGSEVVLGLVRRGHVVHVIREHGVEKEEVYHALANDSPTGRLIVHLVPSWRRTRWSFLTMFKREVRGMRRVLRDVAPDVVFAQWTYHWSYAGLISGFPTLCVGHDSPWTVLKTFRNFYALFHAFYCQLFVIPRLKHLSVVSPHIEEDFRKQCGYKREVVVIPNGIKVRSGELESGEDKKVIRRAAKTIVCVSQAGRLKNTNALAKAFEVLKAKHVDWQLKMYGQGLPDGMATREALDRVLKEEADVFCSPSLEESFGMVFVEAMIQGVPCVGGEKSGAVPWVMGEGGVTCDVTNPEKLAACLEDLMLDYEKRKRLSEAGIKRVREMFDIEKTIDAYERELVRIVKEGRQL